MKSLTVERALSQSLILHCLDVLVYQSLTGHLNYFQYFATEDNATYAAYTFRINSFSTISGLSETVPTSPSRGWSISHFYQQYTNVAFFSVTKECSAKFLNFLPTEATVVVFSFLLCVRICLKAICISFSVTCPIHIVVSLLLDSLSFFKSAYFRPLLILLFCSYHCWLSAEQLHQPPSWSPCFILPLPTLE